MMVLMRVFISARGVRSLTHRFRSPRVRLHRVGHVFSDGCLPDLDNYAARIIGTFIRFEWCCFT